MQAVGGVKGIGSNSAGREFDALWLRPLDVICTHIVFGLCEADMQLSRHRSINVPVRQVPLLLVHLYILVAVEFGDSTYF